jgi:hypothetical protein
MTEEEFKAALPEDLRANPSITKFKDLGALAKSYVEAQGLLGNSIRPPSAEATAEAKADFRKKLMEKVPELVYAPEGDEETEKALYARLGRPEKADAYEVVAEAADAGMNADELRALATAVGLTKKQFTSLQKAMIEPTLALKQKAADAQKALKTEWGVAYDERLADAKAAAAKMGLSAEEVAALPASQLKAFANVAKAVGAGGAPFDGDHKGAARGGKKTPAEANAEIEEIQNRPEYFRPQPHQRATHERLKLRVQELMEMAG